MRSSLLAPDCGEGPLPSLLGRPMSRDHQAHHRNGKHAKMSHRYSSLSDWHVVAHEPHGPHFRDICFVGMDERRHQRPEAQALQKKVSSQTDRAARTSQVRPAPSQRCPSGGPFRTVVPHLRHRFCPGHNGFWLALFGRRHCAPSRRGSRAARSESASGPSTRHTTRQSTPGLNRCAGAGGCNESLGKWRLDCPSGRGWAALVRWTERW